MIRRLLIFLVLLTTGFFVLFTLIEERSRPGINPAKRQQNSGPSIKVKEIEVRPSGRLHIPVRREVELSGGRKKLLPVYDLHAEDSEPGPNNTQLLKKVLVEFYEIQDNPPQEPKGPQARRTSWMTADRALLQLSQDESGRVRVSEDKQMEFWGVRFHTAPDASVPSAEIAIQHAIAVNDINELRLWTPTDDVPVRVLAQGRDGFKVNGLGIRAYLPARRGRKGKVAVQRQGSFRFTIASHPVLVRGNTTLKSRGPLEYREDMAAGVASISLRDEVEVRGLTTTAKLNRFRQRKEKVESRSSPPSSPRSAPPTAVALVARGRWLNAFLARCDGGKAKDSTAMAWTRIILWGHPVQVEGGDMRLTCDRVEALPDLAGEPCWITASGLEHPPTMYQESAHRQARVIATKHIHLIRPVHTHLALLSAYGLPEVAMPEDHGQLIIFEGPATVIAEQDQITATAADGLVATRGEDTATTFFGKGKVHLKSPEWIVDGNRGFRLREVPQTRSRDSAVDRFLRLGSKGAGRDHAYRIERLPVPTNTPAAVERLVTTGTGACHLTLKGDGNGSLRLDSGSEDIRILVDGDQGELQRVASLDVRFHDKRGVLGLVATGQDCPLRYQLEQAGWVVGNAGEIHVPAPGVLRLLGKPRTRVHQEKPMRIVEGREILFQRLGEKAGLLRCTGDARLRLRQQKPDNRLAAGNSQDVELLADDIRMLPYLETPTAWGVHARGLPAYVDSILAHGHRAPYLFATGSVRLLQRDTSNKVVGRGFGEHLALRFDSAAHCADGRLTGVGSKLIRIDSDGSTRIAEARIIRFANDRRGEHLDLVTVGDFYPRVTLPSSSPDTGQVARSGATLVICKGDIAITPDQVRFLGPMEAQAMDQGGKVDPKGLHMTAASMLMDRDKKTGDVTRIHANNDIWFHLNDMEGEADEVSVDLRRTLIVARGHDRRAVLRQANGRIIKAAQVNHNYRTKQTQSWNGRIVQATTPK